MEVNEQEQYIIIIGDGKPAGQLIVAVVAVHYACVFVCLYCSICALHKTVLSSMSFVEVGV